MSENCSEQISPEVVERMASIVREVSTWTWIGQSSAKATYAEARAIAALLPKPVDPDLIEARAIAAAHHHDNPPCERAGYIGRGEGENWWEERCILVAIKRGRELAAQETTQ